MTDKTATRVERFLSRQPTHIATVRGYHLYEDPIWGDEAPIQAITPEGRLVDTRFFDVPTTDELAGV